MPGVRGFASRSVGGIQCVLGGMASMFAYVVYARADMRQILDIGEGEVGIVMLLLVIFGVFSIMSGAKLMSGER